MYSPEVLDHFQNPRNVGEVDAPAASVQVENPVCGDVLKLTLKLHGNRIVDIRFRAKGCVSAMACGSAITEMAVGQTINRARQIDWKELETKVGGLPQASTHAAHLAVDALVALLKSI